MQNDMTVEITEVTCDAEGCRHRWTPPDNTNWRCPACGSSNRCGARELGCCPGCQREVLGVRIKWRWRPLCHCEDQAQIPKVDRLEYRYVTEWTHPWAKAVCESPNRPAKLNTCYKDVDWAALSPGQRLRVLGLGKRDHRDFERWALEARLSDPACDIEFWWPKCRALVALACKEVLSFDSLRSECLRRVDQGWTPWEVYQALRFSSNQVCRSEKAAEKDKGSAPLINPYAYLMSEFKKALDKMMAARTVSEPTSQLKHGRRDHSFGNYGAPEPARMEKGA